VSSTRQLILHAAARLQQAGCDAPKLDAELLLMHAWSVQRTDLIMRAHDHVPEHIQTAFHTLIQSRCKRQPLAYILGIKEFWSRDFQVNPDVLIPRPETEHLIEAMLEYFPDRLADYCFADIGTGSGCIAITLACEFPNAQVIASDISPAALSVASRNAITHHVAQRIHFRQGDMLSAINKNDLPCHAIVSNPPYVSKCEMTQLQDELFHEPRHALTDEADGLHFLHIMLQSAPEYLHPNGLLMLETGPCGLPSTPKRFIFERDIHDLAGHARGGIYRLAPSS